MKNMKRLFVLALIMFCTVFVASCKNCGKDSGNKTVPSLSNPNEVFLQIGDYKITNQKVYHQLLNSYGTEAILNIVDDALLPAVSNEADFQEYLNETIYGTEELTAEEKSYSAPPSAAVNHPTNVYPLRLGLAGMETVSPAFTVSAVYAPAPS